MSYPAYIHAATTGHSPLTKGNNGMKFVTLNSRGGNYLVVASNVAWLRTSENGQTLVGMVGGAPILVTGSIEETAATILADVGG
jgi:hypothetical protein